MIETSVRLILSVILIYFVYGETGWATALAISLIAINNEITALLIRDQRKKLSRFG